MCTNSQTPVRILVKGTDRGNQNTNNINMQNESQHFQFYSNNIYVENSKDNGELHFSFSSLDEHFNEVLNGLSYFSVSYYNWVYTHTVQINRNTCPTD